MRTVSSGIVAFVLFGAVLLAGDGASGPAVPSARRPLPEISGDAFHFLVMADNQPHGDAKRIEVRPEFEAIVAEANRLDPDLVLFAGDQILGYEGDDATVRRMWDAFDAAAAKLRAPYRMAPGNHDIWGEASRSIWTGRYGPAPYAFTMGGCRFVALNSEESFGRGDRLGPEQIAFLKREVEGAKECRHLFVFLHKPLWRFEPGSGPWMEEVHPILREHPSVTVFTGHFHQYERSNVRDGVRYFIAPAAGGPVGSVEAAGEFHGYLHVAVRGDAVTVAPIRAGAVLPEDLTTEDRQRVLYALQQSLELTPIVVGGAGAAARESRLSVTNGLDEPLEISVEVVCPEGCTWEVEAPDGPVAVAPGARGERTFRLTGGEEPFPLPRVTVEGRAGGVLVLRADVDWPVKVDRRLEVARAAAAPVLDGKLDDAAWADAAPAGRFLSVEESAWAPRDTRWRALWDEENLYLALEMEEPHPEALLASQSERDWPGLSDDAVLVYLDFVGDGQSRFCFGANVAGVPAEYRAPGGALERDWSGPWTPVAAKTASGWTLEVAIPWRSLGVDPSGGMTFRANVIRCATPGGPEYSAWSMPHESISNPLGYGEAVLR